MRTMLYCPFGSLYLLVWSLLLLLFVADVNGEIYVVNPLAGSTCRGGERCTVQWLDDGTSPLLTSIGLCNVGVYTGHQKLVQQLGPIDVSSARSLTFNVNPKAGPNSASYYIAFVSTNLRVNNSDSPYIGFSPFFRLNNMSGSLASPLPSSSFSTPAPSSNTVLPTISVAPLSKPSVSSSAPPPPSSPPAPPSPQSSSRFITSPLQPSSSSSSAAPSSSSANSNAASGTRLASAPLSASFALALVSATSLFVFAC